MSQRLWTQFEYGLERKACHVYATVDFNDASAPIVKKFSVSAAGGAGSYATTTAAFKGFTGITRTAQGKYTLTFEDRYVRLLRVECTFVAIDGVTSPKALNFFVMSDTLTTTKTIVLGFTNTANSATLVDLGANDRLQFEFVLSDSTV